MHTLEGYSISKGQVCTLIKSLYGLKQARRQWNIELTSKLCAHGFRQSEIDNCLCTKCSNSTFLAFIIYVDMLITGQDEKLIFEAKAYLHTIFTIKDLDHVKYFLSLKITRSSEEMFLYQHKYINDIVTGTGLNHAKTTNFYF